jgi:hypothetical protein
MRDNGTIGIIDVGFSWAKGLAWKPGDRPSNLNLREGGKPKEKRFHQPSLVGNYETVFEENIKPEDIVYRDNQNEFFVGKATRHSKVLYATKKADKANTWTTGIIIKAAMAQLAPNQKIKLVTSLPMDFYNKQKKDFQGMLDGLNGGGQYQVQIGRNKTITTELEIIKHKIVPQGYNSGMDYLLDDNGKIARDRREDAKRSILVIDPGFFTLGLIIIEDLEIAKGSCSPQDMGINVAYELIMDYMRDEIGIAPNLYDLDRYIIAREYDGLDMSPLIEQALQIYAQQIQMQIDNFNRTFWKYIVTGGWAPEIAKYLDIPQDRLIISDQFGNARGNRKIGVRLWGNMTTSATGPARTTTYSRP